MTNTIWTDEFKPNSIKISMNGKGRWTDSDFFKRPWRSLEYECVYLNAFNNMIDAKEKLNFWIDYCNYERAEVAPFLWTVKPDSISGSKPVV